MKLIVGLGNPGPKYEQSRHNIGFWVIDRIAQQLGVSLGESVCEAIVGRVALGAELMLLAKPQTFMNRSGLSVRGLRQRFEADPADMIVVVYDDLDLPFGRIRIRTRGSAGGHRGIQSILDALAEAPFFRVRIGVGRPPEGTDAANFVLQPLSMEEMKGFGELIDRGAQAVKAVLTDGVERAMEQFNRAQ